MEKKILIQDPRSRMNFLGLIFENLVSFFGLKYLNTFMWIRMGNSDPGKTSWLRNTAGTYSVDFVGVTYYIIEHTGTVHTVHTLGAMQVPK
jgi:hypothetical protein